MSSKRTAKVSIGLPCYNEAPYIEETLRSLLNQTETDFELFVCDNASTDGTFEIISRVTAGDPRVTLCPNEENKGASQNFTRAVRMARSPYFMWAGGHDLYSNDYVRKLRLLLDADPECSLAYADSIFIHADGSRIPGEPVETGLELSHNSAAERFKILLWKLHRCDLIYGLIRLSMFDTALLGGPRAPDMIVLAGLAIQGRFRRVPELLYFRRRNRGVESTEARLEHLTQEGIVNKHEPEPLAWQKVRDSYLALLDASKVSSDEKRRLHAATCQAFKERFGVPWNALEAAPWHERLLLRFAKGDSLQNLQRRIQNRIVSRAKLDDEFDLRTHYDREIASLLKENHRLRRDLAKARKNSRSSP